jgi:putative ABC transport system ATP-binding protein
MSHFPSQLSGGQQQRAALAQAIIHDLSVLFADEPTGQFDLGTRKQVMGVLKRWLVQGEDKRCLIWVTHHHMSDLDLMGVNDFLFIEEKNAD